MADGVKFTVRNKDKLFKKLGRLVPAVIDAVDGANHQAADEMADMARRLVKRKTGKLAATITVTPPGGVPPAYSQGGGGGPVPPGSYAVSAGDKGVRTAHLVEFGTKPHIAGGKFAGAQHPGSAPQPFFWPAYRATKRKHKGRVSRAINGGVKKAVSG